MTFVVYDGKTVIADCYLQTTSGSGFISRRPISADGSPSPCLPGKDHKVIFNDAKKLVFLPNAKWEGKKILCFSLAGRVDNLDELVGALSAGVDLANYISVDVNISPVANRRIFNGNSTLMILTEDNNCYRFVVEKRQVVWYKDDLTTMGSGSDVVDTINGMLKKDLTSLEAFVLASCHTRTVSRKFDYFIPATGEYKINQQLTKEQEKAILKSIQSRINLQIMYNEPVYINEKD